MENQVAGTSNSNAPGREKDDGVAGFWRGINYQKDVAFLLVCHAIKLMQDDKTFEFTITSEDPKGGKFDDVVIRCKHGSHAFNIFIQAKQKKTTTKEVRLEDLRFTGDNDFSISKYFNDFMLQKWDTNELNVLVLCTNIGLAEDVKPYVEKCSLDESVDSFLTSLSDDVYKIDGDKIDENTKTSLINHISENSDLYRIAKELADCVFYQKAINLQATSFQNYQPVIKQLAIQVPKKNGFYKVKEEVFESDDVVVKDFKDIFEKPYGKLLKKSLGEGQHQDIWEDIKGKQFKLTRGSKEKSENQDCALPSKVDESQIREFLKSFRLVCSTKHEKNYVIANMHNLEPSSLSEPEYDFLYDRLSNWIIEWIGRGDGAFFEQDDVQDFFNTSAYLLKYLQIAHVSKLYCTTLQNMDFQCKNDTLEKRELYKKLKLWLSETKTDKSDILKVNVLPDKYPQWFVLQILQSVKAFYKEASNKQLDIIFLKEKYFKENNESVKNIFCAMNFPLVLVIDRSEDVNKECDEFSNWLLLHDCYKKMIITIEQSSTHDCIEEPLYVKDLTDDCKRKKLNTSAIYFGTTILYEDIIYDGDDLTFVSDVESFPKESVVFRNINNERFNEIEPMNVSRRWKRGEISDNSFDYETTGAIWRSVYNIDIRRQMLQVEDSTENRIPIERFLDEFSSITHERLIHLQTLYIAEIENKSAQNPLGFTTDDSNSDGDSSHGNMKAHIIFNQAGSGKSFYMIWLANYLQSMESHKDFWVINVKLIEHCAVFSETQLNFQNMIKIDAIRLLFQLIYLDLHVNNKFRKMTDLRKTAATISKCLQLSARNLQLDESNFTCSSEHLVLLRIFKSKYDNKKLILLMDGFDEIAPHYKKTVLKFLETLRSLEGVSMIYLTSRPYNFKPEMEASLGPSGYYYLENFNEKEFLMCIHKFCKTNIKFYNEWDRKKQNDILRVQASLLELFLSDIVKIPLFFSMGSELLLSIVDKNLNSQMISLEIFDDCKKQFSPIIMIETFIKKKLFVSLEKDGASADKPNTRITVEEKYERIKKTHSILAMIALMSQGEVKELLPKKQQEEADRYIEELKNGTEKSGIVAGVVDNVPIFVHRLFAEYFAARWFFSNVDKSVVKNFLKCHVYGRKEKEEIRNFLERIICEDKVLHTAILDDLQEKVEKLLIEFPHLIKETDCWGRAPLQLAMVCKSKFMVGLLLDSMDGSDTIDVKDKYLDWTALDCAHNWLKSNGGGYDDTKSLIEGAFKFESDLLDGSPGAGRNRRVKFLKRLFTKLVLGLASRNQLDLGLSMQSYYYSRVFPSQFNRQTSLNWQNRVTLLELCTVIDSPMLQILVEHSNENIASKASHLIQLAFEFQSVNALQFLTVNRNFSLPEVQANFEHDLLLLVAYMQGDVRKFRDAFHKYCVKYRIQCAEEHELPAILEVQSCANSISLQRELSRYFPSEFSDNFGVDIGTEQLISRALHTDSLSILKYLIQKLNIIVNIQLIKRIVQIHRIYWCQSTFNFLIHRCNNLTEVDENGRNLLHFAVVQGELSLVKCLIECGFNTTDTNSQEKNWDALFYCVQKIPLVVNNAIHVQRLNIFKYFIALREETPLNCFNRLDSGGKSVFYYAAEHVSEIADYIIQRQFCTRVTHFNEEKMVGLMNLLCSAGFNLIHMLSYFHKRSHLSTEPMCELICKTLATNNHFQYKDSMNRNLLQIAIRKRWFGLAKCLIDHHQFNVEETNEQENNWNAFFYCVEPVVRPGLHVSRENTISFFFYLMNRNPRFDYFGQLDSYGKSVFYYANTVYPDIADVIIQRQFPVPLNNFTLEQITSVTEILLSSGFNSEEIYSYFEGTHLSHETACLKICETLNGNNKLEYKDSEHRNLLHIAIHKGRFVLAKCLIHHFAFDVEEKNDQENGWNAFFYCVASSRISFQARQEERKDFFSYMLSKKSMHCFRHRDLGQKNVFYYAIENSALIADSIIINEFNATGSTSVEQQSSVFFNHLKETGHAKSKVGKLLNNWLQVSTLASKQAIYSKMLNLIDVGWTERFTYFSRVPNRPWQNRFAH